MVNPLPVGGAESQRSAHRRTPIDRAKKSAEDKTSTAPERTSSTTDAAPADSSPANKPSLKTALESRKRAAADPGLQQRRGSLDAALDAKMAADEPKVSAEEKAAREVIDEAMSRDVSSSDSDDYVRDNVDATVLKYAQPNEKAHMLKSLMDGPTGADDEEAMGTILKSVESPEEMKQVMDGAGGIDEVWDELDSQQTAVVDHLKSKGEAGLKTVASMARQFPVSSSASDDFVANHVDAKVLEQASNEDKSHMLKSLMDGPTGGRDEAAMRRVLESVTEPADMKQVLADAGGVDEVWDELEGEQDAFITHLKSQGDKGHKMIAEMASSFPVTSSESDDFVRDHVDDNVLAQASVDDKAHMVKSLRDGNFSAEDDAAMQRVLTSAKDPIELMAIADKAGGLSTVLGMDASHRQLVTDAFNANKTDATYTQNLEKLIVDPKFRDLSADEKTAVLSQAKNYPDHRSVSNMQRMLQKDWFTSQTLEDKQRSLKTVAFISQHAGDRTVIDNTLNSFLGDSAPYEFNWERGGTAYGDASGSAFRFNRRYLPAGNGKVDTTNSDTLHMVTHTVAHEVNHLVNGDTVAKTHDYFMGEYRAYYAGFKAEHGRDPTRDEVIDRVRHLLTSTSGAYDSIRQALADPTEGPKIVAFMKQVLGRNDVTQANAATLAVTNGTNAAPRPVGGDIDN